MFHLINNGSISTLAFTTLALGATLAVRADVLLTGVYDSPTTNANQIDSAATSDLNANQLSLTTFTALVESAFLTKTGGVVTFDNETPGAQGNINFESSPGVKQFSNLKFGDGTVLAQIRRTVSGTNVVNDLGAADRTPISGSQSFGGSNNYGFEFKPSEGLQTVGLTIISRSGQTGGTITITATFADTDGLNPVNIAVSDALASANGTDDTFFGFVAPNGKSLAGLQIVTPYFTRVDDLAFTTVVPEPASLALLGVGALALVTRRRKA